MCEIRSQFPQIKLGIFTRSPRSYAETVLKVAYPSLKWDVIVAYEDVSRTKPYGEGIDKAMRSLDCRNLNEVILVGDGDVDIRAAYNAGCLGVLDRSSWGHQYTPDNWKAISRVPDAVIHSPKEILRVLDCYELFLPELERQLSDQRLQIADRKARYDRVNKFVPSDIGGDKTAFYVYSCGRSFADYESIEQRRHWHQLTQSIHDQKEADEFPEEWLRAVKTFITMEFGEAIWRGEKVIVSVIPHRPGRKPRLETFLEQLAEFCAQDQQLCGKGHLSFIPDLLGYKSGVLSNSNDKLNLIARFKNVRDYLFVNREAVNTRAKFLIIDDVCTTGSSLIYARKYLIEAGAKDIKCLCVAMSIGNVLYE